MGEQRLEMAEPGRKQQQKSQWEPQAMVGPDRIIITTAKLSSLDAGDPGCGRRKVHRYADHGQFPFFLTLLSAL